MTTLEDLTTKTTSIDDLVMGDQPAAAVPNKASNQNLAAHAALINTDSEGVLVENFNTTMADLDKDPSKANVDRILELAKQQQYVETRDALTDFLADPNVSDEHKANAANGVLDINTSQYDSNNILSRNALMHESMGEGVEPESVRISLAESVEELNEVKRQQQALLQREVAKGDASMLSSFADIFEAFIPFMEQKDVGDTLDALRDGEGWALDESFLALGSTKMELREMVTSIPPNERMAFSQKLADAIQVGTTTTLVGENDYLQYEVLRTTLEDGYYSDGDKWVDNAVSMLDLIGLGASVKSISKGIAKRLPKSLTTSVVEVRNARRAASTSRVARTSPASNVKDTNPGQAKAMHEAAAMDDSQEAAGALYGTTREDALANDLTPLVASVDGSVTAKVNRIDEIERMATMSSKETLEDARTSGYIELTKAEKASARAKVINDFEQVQGFTNRGEMNQIEEVASGVKIKSVYGPSQSGFSSAKHAMDNAEWALRDYGVSSGDITLLVRQGGEYVPTTLKDQEAFDIIERTVTESGKPKLKIRPKQQQDYLIQVDHEYKFNPADVTEWAKFDVKYNFMDRLPATIGNGKSGSLQRTLIDPASSLDPQITLSANVGFDKAAHMERTLLNLGDSFATKFKSLTTDRQKIMDDLIRESNSKGLAFDYNKMAREGFSPNEIDAMKSWREYWDTTYVLSNRDMATTLKGQGYKEFIDVASETKLIAKPLARNRVKGTIRVYDHVEDVVVSLNKSEVDDLYKAGGELATMKQPISVGDEAAELIISRNSPGGSYLKSITDSSEVLAYRDGYYTVQYSDPYFIAKVVKDSNGDELYQKAVATAGGVGDAKALAARLQAGEVGNAEYIFRSDVKGVKNSDSSQWDLQQARGLTSQKVRGQRLEDGTSNIDELSTAPILDPVESMVASARSLGARVPMRKVIETHKRRFVEQYGEYLPKGKYDQTVWTTDPSQLRYRNIGSEDNAKLADARTTFEYINYLEGGYINAIDDGVKNSLKALSNIAGDHNWKSLEKASMWMSNARGPSAMGKNLAFNMYLAANPIRQFIVQGHQAVQLAANFPKWSLSRQPSAGITALLAENLGAKSPEWAKRVLGLDDVGIKKLYQDWEMSGLSASVDKQNLIRGSLADLADTTQMGKLRKGITAPLTLSRKVGFDAGENINLMTAWLAHRSKALDDGLDIADQAVLDTISGKARNYTYNMNAAGDMPYNQNSLAVLFQFLQVPHKALTTMTTNRALTPMQKLRLGGFNATMFTLPPAAMVSIFGDFLPSDAATRDLALNGLEGFMFNSALSFATGEDSYLDWSGLSAVDMFGTYDFIHSLATSDVGTILANTPSGALLFGNNPRITNFAKSAARYFNLVDDFSDPVEFGDVAMDFAKLSSGFSSAFKASYALKYGVKRSSLGGITDPNVNTTEAIMQAAGFPTMDETMRRWVKQDLYEKSNAYREDVTAWYKDLKKSVLRQGITPQEVDYTVKMFSEAFRVWGNDGSKAKGIIDSLIRKDVDNGDVRLYKQILQAHGIMGGDELKAYVNALGGDMTEEQKKGMNDAITFIQEQKGEI